MEVGGGFRISVRQKYPPVVSQLWEERPPRYSRAMLETLALIAYRQPITRGEIEDIRGVSVSTNIIKTLQEREWVKSLGHKDVPGRPTLYGTTREFLDYFNLKSLNQLPTLAEIRDLDQFSPEFPFEDSDAPVAAASGEVSPIEDNNMVTADDEAVSSEAASALPEEGEPDLSEQTLEEPDSPEEIRH